MNIIKSFNNTIDYLETVLDDEINEKKVTQLSGYSYSMFSRLFSILTETTLSEYIRSRKLKEAAVILRDTDEKIIDVALKFGYESSDSFGTAFKNFHGFTPSEVRNGKPFKIEWICLEVALMAAFIATQEVNAIKWTINLKM